MALYMLLMMLILPYNRDSRLELQEKARVARVHWDYR